MAAVSDRNALVGDFSALSLRAEVQAKPVSKEVRKRFSEAEKAFRAIGTIGAFFCETDADLTTFCLVSKQFNSSDVKPYIFSGNSELPRLLNNHCARLDKYGIPEKMAVAWIWAAVTETPLSNGRAQTAFFDKTYSEQAARDKLVKFACATVEEIPVFKWFKTYHACKRLREQFVNSKLITSWTFSCKDMRHEEALNVENMKKVLTAFSTISSATIDPYPYKLVKGILQAFIGHSIVQLNVCMDFSPEDFQAFSKMTTLQKLTLIGSEFQTRFHFDLLGAHPNLTSLTTYGSSSVSDRDLIHFPKLPKLQSISLPNSRISNRGVALLANVKNLTELEVTYLEGDDSNQISNEGLKHLKDLKLKRLNLTGCKKGVSPEFLMHLRHPKCLFEVNLSKTFLSKYAGSSEDRFRKIFDENIKPLAKFPHLVPLESNPLHFVRKVVTTHVA